MAGPPRARVPGAAAVAVPGAPGAAAGPAVPPALSLLLPLLLLLPAGATRLPPQELPEMPPPALPGPPPQVARGDKPAAHVVASSWPSSRGSLRWQAGVAPALVRNGVRLRGNRLVVPRDGLYFVYASAAFTGGRCGPGGAPRRPLRLAVSRLSREYPRDVPLLRAARSVCPAGGLGGLWAETLYQGAVFQLRRGDRLAATTSAGRFLDLHGAGQAYFGVLGVD
ncbi:LOW QUALITY PROTEIN: lymphotoxin-alpha-like [Agelaius tricolor]|uniref:LOW QUALITY PROTEIN: lymphotoxin-alpha-like n=1 Tax=Agelaius tricolor TaxID=9191 RepID=UPI0039F20272